MPVMVDLLELSVTTDSLLLQCSLSSLLLILMIYDGALQDQNWKGSNDCLPNQRSKRLRYLLFTGEPEGRVAVEGQWRGSSLQSHRSEPVLGNLRVCVGRLASVLEDRRIRSEGNIKGQMSPEKNGRLLSSFPLYSI